MRRDGSCYRESSMRGLILAGSTLVLLAACAGNDATTKPTVVEAGAASDAGGVGGGGGVSGSSGSGGDGGAVGSGVGGNAGSSGSAGSGGTAGAAGSAGADGGGAATTDSSGATDSGSSDGAAGDGGDGGINEPGDAGASDSGPPGDGALTGRLLSRRRAVTVMGQALRRRYGPASYSASTDSISSSEMPSKSPWLRVSRTAP